MRRLRAASRDPNVSTVAALAFSVCLLAAGCSRPLVRLPTGSSVPVSPPAAAAALAQAAKGCGSVRTLTAEVAVSGSAGGRRLRGRLLTGVAAPASVRLEAVAPFGQPLFIFVATGGEATLLLPRDERVLESRRPDAVLEAIAGVPLGAAELRTTLTGCAAPDMLQPAGARAFGDSWIVISAPAGDELYLQRDARDDPWKIVAATRRTDGGQSWRAEYADRQADVPRTIRVASIDDGGGGAFDLRLALSQVEINTPLESDVFAVRVPPETVPITLEELRASGPLAPQ